MKMLEESEDKKVFTNYFHAASETVKSSSSFSRISRDEGHALISSFQKNEYKCFGSCYCAEDSRRTAAASVSLVRGVTLVLTSITAFMAINQAQNLFTDYCKDTYSTISGQCSGDVFSEVDDCKVNAEEYYGKYKSKEDFEKSYKEALQLRDFSCEGQCIPLIFDDHEIEIFKKNAYRYEQFKIFVDQRDTIGHLVGQMEERIFKCRTLNFKKDIRTDIPNEEWLKADGDASGPLIAENFFMDQLNDFCEKQSTYEIPKDIGGVFYGKANFCRGFKYTNPTASISKKLNPYVKCTEIEKKEK